MLKDKESPYVNNKFEILTALKGEKIQGIFLRKDGNTTHYCLIFESGWGFNWTSSGSFWILTKKDVNMWLSKKIEEIEMKKQELSLLLEMAGDKYARER